MEMERRLEEEELRNSAEMNLPRRLNLDEVVPSANLRLENGNDSGRRLVILVGG